MLIAINEMKRYAHSYMLIAIRGVKLYAQCYTRSEAISSLLYIE